MSLSGDFSILQRFHFSTSNLAPRSGRVIISFSGALGRSHCICLEPTFSHSTCECSGQQLVQPDTLCETKMADLQPEALTRSSAAEQSQTLMVADTNNHLTGYKSTKIRRSTQNRAFWVVRATFAIIGAILYTALYAVIIFVYIRRKGDNDVIDSPYPVDARIVSGLWFVFSVFILDLSRIGLAACETAGLTLKTSRLQRRSSFCGTPTSLGAR